MNADTKDKFYKAGYQAGTEHSQPSQTTLNFMQETQDIISELRTNQQVLLERLTNFIDINSKEHLAVLEQTKKTNGTVADIQKWRYLITGGLVLMNVIFVPILIYLFTKIV